MDRSSPPLPTDIGRAREHVLSQLKEVVREIQSTDRQLTDLVIPQDIYDQCRRFAEEALFRYRYKNHKVFEILQKDSEELIASEAEVNKMKNGLKSLLRYPLNLLVAPNRPELKIIKASTSFFMFQVKRNLKDAHSFLKLMGYDQVRNATDLSLNKSSFSIERVYTLVLDIVVLHEELEIISFLISQSRPNDIKFYHYFIARQYGPSDKWDCLDYIRKGEAAREASYLEEYRHPSSSYSLTTDRGQGRYREHSTGQSYHTNDYRDYSDGRYDNTDYGYRHDGGRGASQGYYHEDEQRRYHYPYGNESGQYHQNQYESSQYRTDSADSGYPMSYHGEQYYNPSSNHYGNESSQYRRDQYQGDQYPRGQRYYDDDQTWYQQEDREQSRKRREVECDGGLTSQSYNDTTACISPNDSIIGMPPPMFNAIEMMRKFKPSSTPKKDELSDDQQHHSLNHTVSKSDSFNEQHGFKYGRRSSSTPSFRSDSSYTDNMYRPFDDQPAVFSPSESVKFTITEEIESERNEDKISSNSPRHVNQDERSIKPRRNESLIGGAGSTDHSNTWSGTNADREVIRRQMSKDDSVLEGHRRGSYNNWTCTFCSNENYGRNICEACNQERAASLYSY